MSWKSAICLYEIRTHFSSRFSLPQICAMFYLIKKKGDSDHYPVPSCQARPMLIVNSEFYGKKLM